MEARRSGNVCPLRGCVIILVDLNQVMISNMMVQIGNHKNMEVDEGMVRHLILNTLRFNRQKFHKDFGEMIICADDKNYWRRKVFPYYKATRKRSRDESEMDWNAIFTALNNIREELKEFFPYKVIQVDTAEADDIIGTIVHYKGTILNTSDADPILILSGDKDFIQLHDYANVKQYDPTRKRWIRHSKPKEYLREHIIRGDKSDGVPNVLSKDDVFMVGGRQKPITKKKLEEFIVVDDMPAEIKRNWDRNRSMIDLRCVPNHIQDEVLDKYNEVNNKDRSKLFNYFIKNKLKHLMENINEFWGKIMAYVKALNEIIDEVTKQKKKADKVKVLKQHDSLPLRNFFVLTYDKSKEFLVPDSEPPYTPNPSSESQGAWNREMRKMKYVVNGFGGEKVQKIKRENIFIQMLETVDKDDAPLFVQMIQKKPIKGITKETVNEAFGNIIK